MRHSEASGDPKLAYPQLVERAIACIEQRGGVLDEDHLIAIMFGNTSSARLWRPLLRSILDQQTRIQMRSDGMWTTRVGADSDTLPTEFVVIDVETTGLKPSQQRVIEIAIIRVCDAVEPLVWSTLVRPDRKGPQCV